MCYGDDDLVPAVPGAAVAVRGEELDLPFPAYLANPEGPPRAGIVLLPDAGGLDPFYRELARRFAGLGHPTLAIDYYGRTAGSRERDGAFQYLGHQRRLRRAEMLLDVAAGVARLGGSPYLMGFCLGGATALLAGATDLDVRGVVAFYPWAGDLGLEPALPDDFVAGVRRPVLGLFGGGDTEVPVAVARAYDEHLGADHEVVIYPGAPHGFFERHYLDRERRPELVDDVWRRLAKFLL